MVLVVKFEFNFVIYLKFGVYSELKLEINSVVLMFFFLVNVELGINFKDLVWER